MKLVLIGSLEIIINLSAAIRPISKVKAQAAETILTFSEEVAPLVVITQNSEAKAVRRLLSAQAGVQVPRLDGLTMQVS